MGKVYLICGKICSGKSYYAKLLSMFEVPNKDEIDVWYELNR